MKNASPYLMFNGNCKEAITYYGRCFKTEPKILPNETGDKVMHASVQKGSALIMASDWMEGTFKLGNNSQIYLDCDSQKEVDELHASLSEGGKSTMKPDKVFWGSYFGSVTDKFGVNWMMGYDEPQK
jgi:PhnB protein